MNEERPRVPEDAEEHNSGKVNKSIPKKNKIALYVIAAIVIVITLIVIF